MKIHFRHIEPGYPEDEVLEALNALEQERFVTGKWVTIKKKALPIAQVGMLC